MRWLIFPQLRKWIFLNFTSFTIFCVMICSLWTDHANAYTFTTTIYNAATGKPYLTRFDFHFVVYNKAKNCLLLYEKRSNVDLSTTAGKVTLAIFDKTLYGSTKPPRLIPPDPNISLSTVFSSVIPSGSTYLTVRAPAAPDCTTGYNMSVSNESRIMNVKIVPILTGVSSDMLVSQKNVTVVNGVPSLSSTSVQTSDVHLDAMTISPCLNAGTVTKGVLIGCSKVNSIPTTVTLSDGCI